MPNARAKDEGDPFSIETENRRESQVTADLLHTTFGILFTFVWLFVGQILVASGEV